MGSTAKSKEERCPICGERVPERSASPTYPFCSERCRLIDLGNWLGESYQLPEPPADDEEEKG